jgi:phosphonate transport system permease protein
LTAVRTFFSDKSLFLHSLLRYLRHGSALEPISEHQAKRYKPHKSFARKPKISGQHQRNINASTDPTARMNSSTSSLNRTAPTEIIARQQRSKRRRALWSALATDCFLGWYGVIVAHRFFWHGVILIKTGSNAAPEATFTQHCIYLAVGLALGITLNRLGASVGCLLFTMHATSATSTTSTTNATAPAIAPATAPTIAPAWKRATALHSAWILALLTIVAGWITTKISLFDFFSQQGAAGAARIFGALLTPEFSIAWSVVLATVETIYLALMATLFALPASFVLSFFCARNVVRDAVSMRILYSLIRFFANLTRSIEPLIWAIVFSVWVGIGPFAGMLALGIHTIASLVKQYSEQIEDVDAGPIEAIEATGAAPVLVVWYAIVPQIVLPFLSITIYRWDINVRMATVIGLVGGGGIGTLLVQYQGLARWHEVGLIVMVIAAVVWAMDYLTARIRQAIR